MDTQDDHFDELIANLGAVLALADKDQSRGGGLTIPSASDVAGIWNRTWGCRRRRGPAASVCRGTMRTWEQGRSPQCPACTLLALLDRNPKIVEEILGS
jgi:putative transcriptional regulator